MFMLISKQLSCKTDTRVRVVVEETYGCSEWTILLFLFLACFRLPCHEFNAQSRISELARLLILASFIIYLQDFLFLLTVFGWNNKIWFEGPEARWQC